MAAVTFEFGRNAATQNNGNNRWNNLAAYAAGNAEAACNNEDKNQTFDTLTTRNFADIIFESSVAPRLTGIRFDIDRRRGTGRNDGVTDDLIRITLGNQVGDNRAQGGGWPTATQRATYGGDGDLWGLSQAQVDSIIGVSGEYGRTVNPQFGLDIRPQGRNSAFVRRVRLILFFTINGVKVRFNGAWVDGNPRGRSDVWGNGQSYARIDGRWLIVKSV